MAIATRGAGQVASKAPRSAISRVGSEEVWRQLTRASFAVIGYVTPAGEPRSSGVVFTTVGRRLYLAVDSESWKAHHVAAAKRVSITVPVSRGGLLSLVLPIPPATISFHATAIVHEAGSIKPGEVSKHLERLLPIEGRDTAVVIEVVPEGRFLIYGVGVPLLDMRNPKLARAVIPV